MTPEPPFPAVGGGALRSAALLEYLAGRYRIDVIVFLEKGSADPAATRLGRLARKIHVIELPFHQRGTPARTLRNLGRLWRGVPPLMDRFAGFEGQIRRLLAGQHYEVAVIEHFWCAPYVNELARHAGRTVLDLHNIESVLHARCGATDLWPLAMVHRQFEKTCRRLEQEWLEKFSLLLAASEADAALVRQVSAGAPVEVYPNTLPARALPDIARREQVVVFSANMEYHPNISAVRFFRRRVWPLLRDRWPLLRWELVGKNPAAVSRYTGGDARIRVVGPVEDAIARLAGAKVAVAPLLAGSGTRVKILEAWAAGTPVVATSLGAEGLPARDGEHLLIADTPEVFAAAVSRLLASAELWRKLAAAGRELFEREFTREAGWNKLVNLKL